MDPAPEVVHPQGKGAKAFAKQNDFISLDSLGEADDMSETSSVSSYMTDDGASDHGVDQGL